MAYGGEQVQGGEKQIWTLGMAFNTDDIMN